MYGIFRLPLLGLKSVMLTPENIVVLRASTLCLHSASKLPIFVISHRKITFSCFARSPTDFALSIVKKERMVGKRDGDDRTKTKGAKQKTTQGVHSIKQILPAEKQKGVRTIVRTPFYTSCLARYGVLHLLSVLSGGNEPPFTQGRADYNNKCNTRKKYRQYSYQGVKCSYHTTFLNGGKNIVLHTFYTI